MEDREGTRKCEKERPKSTEGGDKERKKLSKEVGKPPDEQAVVIDLTSDSDGEGRDSATGTTEMNGKNGGETEASEDNGVSVFVGGEEDLIKENVDEGRTNEENKTDCGANTQIPEDEWESETRMRLFFHGNESAKFEQNDTTVYGLAFKGKFNMKKVSDSMEVGKQINNGEFLDPCYVGEAGLQRIKVVWRNEVLELIRKKNHGFGGYGTSIQDAFGR